MIKNVYYLQSGQWSDSFEATSGAGSPDMPKDVQAVPRSPHCIYVSWAEPANNGAAITEYRLESKKEDEDFELVCIYIQILNFFTNVSCKETAKHSAHQF